MTEVRFAAFFTDLSAVTLPRPLKGFNLLIEPRAVLSFPDRGLIMEVLFVAGPGFSGLIPDRGLIMEVLLVAGPGFSGLIPDRGFSTEARLDAGWFSWTCSSKEFSS